MLRRNQFLLVLFAMASVAHAQSVTPNLGMTLPNQHAPNWDVPLNNDLRLIDNFAGTLNSGANINTFLKNLPNCNIAGGYVLSPYTGGCVVAGSGGMVYPGAGIAVSTGSAWGTSLTPPPGGNGFTFLDATSSIQTQLNARVISINGTSGAFTFAGSGVSCTTTTCTFSGAGGSGSAPVTGIRYSPSAGTGSTDTAATSPQVVAALNSSPSSLINSALFQSTGESGSVNLPASSTATTTRTLSGTYSAAPTCLAQPQNITPAASQAFSGITPTVALVSGTAYSLVISVGTASGSATTFAYSCAATGSTFGTSTASIPNGALNAQVQYNAGTGGNSTCATAATGLTADCFDTTNGYIRRTVNGGTYYTPVGKIIAGSGIGVSQTVDAVTLTATSPITNIQITLPTTAIGANSCTTAATATMTGLATTSAFDTAFATSPIAVTGWGASGGLTFAAWPTANTLNWSVCNQTSSSITPGAMTLNVGAK